MTTDIYNILINSTEIPSQYTIEFINFSSEVNKDATSNQQSYKLGFVIVFCVIGFFLNCRVIHHMIDITKRKREERHVNINVCHLCGVTLITIVLTLVYYLQYFMVIGYGPSCYLLSFCRSFATGAIPPINCNIFYERTKESGTVRDGSPFPLRVIWIYAVAIVISIPSYFMVEYGVNAESGLGSCIRITLAGSFKLTVIYMLTRFIVFYILPIVYMSAVIWKIRYTTQMQNIFNRNPIEGRNTSSSLPLCWILTDFFVFIGSWIPHGFFYLLAAILGRQKESIWTGKPFVIAVMGSIQLCYCILFPLMYLRGIEKVPLFKICCCKLRGSCDSNITHRRSENIASMRDIEEILEEQIELSPLDALLSSPSV